MITVGASGDLTNGGLTAKFSNYGKNNVDVFAPGVKIYSTIPGGNTYGNANGTSMAAPVVSGIAALILEHYPKLKPAQVIDILVKSCYKPEGTVTKPGTDEQIAFSELCRSAGIVNAYEALKLAATTSKFNLRDSHTQNLVLQLINHTFNVFIKRLRSLHSVQVFKNFFTSIRA
jgi:cell wall-associated protease